MMSHLSLFPPCHSSCPVTFPAPPLYHHPVALPATHYHAQVAFLGDLSRFWSQMDDRLLRLRVRPTLLQVWMEGGMEGGGGRRRGPHLGNVPCRGTRSMMTRVGGNRDAHGSY